MKDEKVEEVLIEKSNLVAYLSLKKCHIMPVVQKNGRVAFRVRGEVSRFLSELQNDPKERILSYINRLEAVRSLIFTLKNSQFEETPK